MTERTEVDRQRALLLLDSVGHKLAVAKYHGMQIQPMFQFDLGVELSDGDRRIRFEAHLEGLAYAGTAGAEKTARALAEGHDDRGVTVEASIRKASELHVSSPMAVTVREFSQWWSAPIDQLQVAVIARELRNDAAHDFYDKSSEGPGWWMRLGPDRSIDLRQFADGYLSHLKALAPIVEKVRNAL